MNCCEVVSWWTSWYRARAGEERLAGRSYLSGYVELRRAWPARRAPTILRTNLPRRKAALSTSSSLTSRSPAGWRFPEETLTMLEKEVLATTPGPRVAELTHSG